ncbi:energy transducer TonB [Chitinispirillales bacterium ANBcel5]|uniref:energy transducer TonB n=1 Tax=Cellulosispirillum alkaliphilum TaxID=3039283 RepID=UPI002A53D497|nr:energy transducer TonB [Chitinispirillales bacterium ANBcel5]
MRAAALRRFILSAFLIIVRLVIALCAVTFLFALLPFAKSVFNTERSIDSTRPKQMPVIMQQVVREQKKTEPIVREIRELKTPTSNRSTFSGLGHSMRFTPDLSVDGGGDGVGLGSDNLGSAVFEEGEVDEPARPVSRMGVEYPRRARNLGIEGSVSVVILVGRGGDVLDVTIEETSHQLFVRPVQEAVRQWRFLPAKYQGVPVQVRLRQEINFRLEN